MTDAEILAILAKMIRQRQESARSTSEAAGLELAERERAEIAIIREYMPRQMTEAEVDEAVAGGDRRTGAASIRDMGKVMAALKARHTGGMDFARAGAAIKQALR